MLLLTCGYPFSGKSAYVYALMRKLKLPKNDLINYEPKLIIPRISKKLKIENYIKLHNAALETQISLLENDISKEKNRKLLILDTSIIEDFGLLKNLILKAKESNHFIFQIFVATSVDNCILRSKGNWIPEFEDKYYHSDFEEQIIKLSKYTNKFKLFSNNGIRRFNLNDTVDEISTEIINIKG